MNPLVSLSGSQLERLLAAFGQGGLRYGVTAESLRQEGLSGQQAESLAAFVKERQLSAPALVAVIEAIAQTRATGCNPALAQSLVVTGPDVPGTEILQTGSRFIEVVQHAKRELLLATFALHQGDRILAPIREALLRNPALRVTLVLNISRKYGDKTLPEEITAAYRQEFFSKHWPWPERPEVYFFPDALKLKAAERASMHAKFVIADGERCFITSANFTPAAHARNIEVGVELNNPQEARALETYLKELIRRAVLSRLI